MTDIKTLMPGYEAYKDSGVEWIGEIPAHWEKMRFRFLALAKKGKLPNRIVSVREIPAPVYLSMDYLRGGKSRQWVLDPGAEVIDSNETLLLWDGSNSGEFIKSKRGVLSSTIAYIKFVGLSKEFGWYYSNLIERQLRISTVGMGIPHVDGQMLKNCIILCPLHHEQTAIANFLDCKTTKIDQTVAIKEKQIRLLKERKQILIQNAATKGLDPDVSMRDSGVEWIGDIPHHWDIVANRILFKERVEPGKDGLPLLSVSIHSGISDDEVSEEDNIRGRVKIEDKTKYNIVEPNDIVFNMMRAWQGAIGSSRVKGMVSPAYIIAEPKGKIFSSYFEYQYRCPIFIAQMDRFSKGITDFRKRLYWHEFKQLLTVRPPIDEQKAIVSHIQTQSGKIDKAITIQEQMIEKLKEYKATLINSAVTGKIKVPQTGEAKEVV